MCSSDLGVKKNAKASTPGRKELATALGQHMLEFPGAFPFQLPDSDAAVRQPYFAGKMGHHRSPGPLLGTAAAANTNRLRRKIATETGYKFLLCHNLPVMVAFAVDKILLWRRKAILLKGA